MPFSPGGLALLDKQDMTLQAPISKSSIAMAVLPHLQHQQQGSCQLGINRQNSPQTGTLQQGTSPGQVKKPLRAVQGGPATLDTQQTLCKQCGAWGGLQCTSKNVACQLLVNNVSTETLQ